MNMHAANLAKLELPQREPLVGVNTPHPAREVIGALSGVFADTLDVAQFARHARWNLSGPRAGFLNAMFEELSRILDIRADRIANRIASLGSTVHGTVDAIADTTKIEPLERQPQSEAEWLQAASYRLRLLAASYHDARRACDRLGDIVSSFHLGEGAAAVDHQLCIVDRHRPRA
ncbi:MAG: ferritin-like domain-containing protein [Hyphomicrobiaceae bacterium]